MKEYIIFSLYSDFSVVVKQMFLLSVIVMTEPIFLNLQFSNFMFNRAVLFYVSFLCFTFKCLFLLLLFLCNMYM